MDHMKTNKGGYASLIVQTIISGVIMYLVMFVMIDGLDSFYNNLNMLYMTVMMVAPMVVLMIMAMRHMFPSRGANLAGAIIVFVGSFALISTQTTIGDRAFLRSMIPHHSGAILMCQRAKLTDPEIVRLCGEIERSQRQEIDQMKAILRRI
jgi:uncharacterized protein (DUF305 family)